MRLLEKPVNSDAKEYLIAEHASLRSEIESSTRQIRLLVTFSVMASGLFWSWLSTDGPADSSWLRAIPAAVVTLFWLYNWSLIRDLRRIGDYIAKVELAFNLPPDLGWENSLRAGRWEGAADLWEYLWWVCLLAVNVSLAFFI